ncbi:transposase [Danxiaibacter flavus]|uniref:Transposase n=1 Tax=Danxiaibacter flavus TaxID=3049108 RepID=A0ABV3ZIV4_9BACT|nr:transposase [Chitinophagaceae bacterium DXS]
MEEQFRQLIELLLPEGILTYFELVNTIKDHEGLKIYLEEKNIIPEEFKGQLLHSKGFYPQISIQDFPIRGQEVQLCIKRRRWEIQDTKEIVSRDWQLVQSGTRITKEFAAFLKGILGQSTH